MRTRPSLLHEVERDAGLCPDLDTGTAANAVLARAIAETAVVKLNGGLGTSMGMDRAKSLLVARDGRAILDIIARQVLAARRKHGARLPLVFLNSFRTSLDTNARLRDYPALRRDLPPEIMQNKVPKLLAATLEPVSWPRSPELEWCPPGHGDLYGVLHDSGLLDTMLAAGYRHLFVSNSDNLGAVPDAGVAGWFAATGAPFAIEAVRRTASDRKGGHFARRRHDGRLVLRETAQTLEEDRPALRDLTRHRFASTNNLWLDIAALRDELATRDGDLNLPLIRNVKTVDPTDPTSPAVIQLETAMGAAIEAFPDATTIAVDRSRFIPVKTTDDLLVLRSDCYALDTQTYRLHQVPEVLPYVELSPVYKHVAEFQSRFAAGPPSLARASALRVQGDWRFERGVRIEGDCTLPAPGGHLAAGTVLD